jgi:hypothetical protein
MLNGRQLYLLRTQNTQISSNKLSELLNISENDIIIYEYGKKPIPEELYLKWTNLLKLLP